MFSAALGAALAGGLGLGPLPAEAADAIAIDHAPVYLLAGVPPNVILTLDDSNGMASAHNRASDSARPAYNGSDTSALGNGIYYDPSTVYLPPLRADGTPYPNADFSDAPRDFFMHEAAPDGANGCTLDLRSHYAPVWVDTLPCTEHPASGVLVNNAYTVDPGNPEYPAYLSYRTASLPPDSPQIGTDWALYCIYGEALPPSSGPATPICPAFYYLWDPSLRYGQGSVECSNLVPGNLTENEKSQALPECLRRIVVGSDVDIAQIPQPVREQRAALLRNADEAEVPLTDNYEKTLAERNFANWYSYYRNRWRTLQTAVTRVAYSLDPRVRFAYQGLIPGGGSVLAELEGSFGTFDSSRRQALESWLFQRRPLATRSPLLASAMRVEDFCSSDLAYLEDPSKAEGATLASGHSNRILACRNNFHLVFSDGGWDDPSAPDFAAPAWLGNNDGTRTGLPADRFFAMLPSISIDGYEPADPGARPYADENTGGLADAVFHSWISDLRPSENGESSRVPVLIADPTIPAGADGAYVFWNPRNDPADWQHITTFTVGMGVAGNVSYPSGDYGGGTNIAIDGFPGHWSSKSAPGPSDSDKVDDLWHAGIDGRGGYSLAQNTRALTASFQHVIDAVSAAARQQASAAAPAFNTGSAGTSRMLFQASLDSSDWSGDLRAYQVSSGPGRDPCPDLSVPAGELCQRPGYNDYWSAQARMEGRGGASPVLWSSRRLFTATASYDGNGRKTTAGVAFDSSDWDSLGDGEKRALLGLASDAPIPADDSPQVLRAWAVMDYIAGKRDDESKRRDPNDPYDFRDRDHLLGDIVNAGPEVATTPGAVFSAPSYVAYATREADRKEIVYVGANDGMLHGFDLNTGDELFAYLPRPILGKLSELTDPGYGSTVPHDSFVDGKIATGDADFSGAGDWNPVVVAGLGLGAQALYAIRSPSLRGADGDIAASRVHLWDFTDRDDPDMGYVFGKPSIVRATMADGSIRWVAVFGNGYNSSAPDGWRAAGCDDPTKDSGSTACGRAVLYVVDIETGRLIAKYDTLVGRAADPRYPGAQDADKREPNGLGEPRVLGRVLASDGVQLGGGDPIATLAYAGDLFGNLWRFDLTGLPVGGTVGPRPVLVFKSESDVADGNIVQPITAPLAAVSHPTGVGAMVLFGTGRYLSLADASDTSVQTFYGIWDKGQTGANQRTVVRSDLLSQQILLTNERVADPNSTTLGRTSTRYQPDWSRQLGWKLDLVEQDNGLHKGERVVSGAQVQGDRVIFVSIVPEDDPCLRGGISWVNALDPVTGSALDRTPFDYNLDGRFDTSDSLLANDGTVQTVGTSIRLGDKGGIYSTPAALPMAGGMTKTVVGSSNGDAIGLLQSSDLDWRVWRQIQ